MPIKKEIDKKKRKNINDQFFFFFFKKDINVCNYSIKKVYVSSFGERWSFFFFFFGGKDGDIYIENQMEIYMCV